jgi:methylated-DNA-[protein]-cysteine S-methyltransferase
MYYDIIDSKIGQLGLIVDEDAYVIEILFEKELSELKSKQYQKDLNKTKELREQLAAYFNKKLIKFDLELRPIGTDFQKQVWNELSKIRYGDRISYLDLANRIKNPKAVRAVGSANGKNPIPIVIPCHRVIGKNGKLTGYAGGLEIKDKLLTLEESYVIENGL